MSPDLPYTTMDEEFPLSFVRTSADTKSDTDSLLPWGSNEGDDMEIDSSRSISMGFLQVTPTAQQDLEHDHHLDQNACEAAALQQMSINRPENYLDGLDSLQTQLTSFEESSNVFPGSTSQSTGVATSHPVANSAKVRNPGEEELAPIARKRPRLQNQPASQRPQAKKNTSPSTLSPSPRKVSKPRKPRPGVINTPLARRVRTTSAFGVPLPTVLREPWAYDYEIPDFLCALAAYENQGGMYIRTRPNEAFGVELPEMLLDDDGGLTNFSLPSHLSARPKISAPLPPITPVAAPPASTIKVVAPPSIVKVIAPPSTTIVAPSSNKVVRPPSSGDVLRLWPPADKWPAKRMALPISGDFLVLSPFDAQREIQRQGGLISGPDVPNGTGRAILPTNLPTTSTHPPAGIQWTAKQLETRMRETLVPGPAGTPSKRPHIEDNLAGSSAARSISPMPALANTNTPAGDIPRPITGRVPCSPNPRPPLARNSAA
ncbi:hypothetical protein DFH06DRAFT_57868 [Mycena polygramma]|nr:hypothetical protein DFH06DRAFT_57868 [Mycena polygramma]